MSDLFKAREKVEQGDSWRGSVTVTIDDEQMDLTVRQLRDTEYWGTMGLIDRDELEDLQESLPQEKMESYRELRDADSLTEEEEAKLQRVQEDLESADVDLFDVISEETFEGIRKAAKCGIVPDEEDVRGAIVEHGDEIEEKYGRATSEEARQFLNDIVIPQTIDRSTGFASFSIGIKVVTETFGDSGN